MHMSLNNSTVHTAKKKTQWLYGLFWNNKSEFWKEKHGSPKRGPGGGGGGACEHSSQPTPVAIRQQAFVPKHNMTAVAAMFRNNAIVSQKCSPPSPPPNPLYSEVFLPHNVPCRAGVKTLFKLSFNSNLTPLPFNFHSLHSFTVMKRSHYEKENRFSVSLF